jgi:hypothetical protein
MGNGRNGWEAVGPLQRRRQEKPTFRLWQVLADSGRSDLGRRQREADAPVL